MRKICEYNFSEYNFVCLIEAIIVNVMWDHMSIHLQTVEREYFRRIEAKLALDKILMHNFCRKCDQS
jgi:hypothetical protein